MRRKEAAKIDQRLVKAIGHPLRMELLTILNQKVASPNELAQELRESLGNVSYHVRILADLGVIELVKTEPRRGAVEHYYRALMRPWFTARDWARLPKPARGAISDALLAQVWSETAAAVKAGSFDSRTNRRLLRTTLVLDDEGWDDVAEILDEALERLLEVQTAAAGRLAGLEEPDVSSSSVAVLMHYEVAPSLSSRSPRAKKTGALGRPHPPRRSATAR